MAGSGRPGASWPRAAPLRQGPAPPPRPEGEIVWYHAATPAHAELAEEFCERLTQARPGLHVLLTGAPEVLARCPPSPGVLACPLPNDDGAGAQSFLGHWRPDICIWTAGRVRPVLLAAAHKRGVPLYLVDADETHLPGKGWRFIPSATRTALRRFGLIMARNAAAEAALRRLLSWRDADIAVTGPLRVASKPLPFDQGDHEELSALLRARPVWLAAHLHPEEAATVVQANAEVMRVSHRALLIVAPENPGDSGPFHDALKAGNLRYVACSEGTLPDETTQAILADTDGELGLWYRLAPIAFMGGSLLPGGRGSDPDEPAAHGSAILYGPNIRDHVAAYASYAEAGAARIVRDAATLAGAVRRTIPPDQSARMAHAAWDVATRNAAVMDRLVDIVLTALDARGAD